MTYPTKEANRAAQKRWREANPEKYKLKQRRNHLMRFYKMTLEVYDELLTSQGGCCAVCGIPETERKFSVDHDHNCCPGEKTCGKCIRSLLCMSCNIGIGKFRDNPEILEAAAAYVRSFI